jgi:hypothetical protein
MLLDHRANTQTNGALLLPGQTVTVTIDAHHGQVLSFAAMLIPTNDTFVALDRVRLPHFGTSRHVAVAYDAGTELNDQNCANIPGPICMGEGFVEGPQAGGEGFVHVATAFMASAPRTMTAMQCSTL